MGDKPQIINGNLIIGKNQSIGFGTPKDPQVLEAVGPQIRQVADNPNGNLVAPAGSLAVRSDIPALYQNTNGVSNWIEVGVGSNSPPVLADPGDGNPIPVTQSARIYLSPTTSLPPETNTLPNATVDGLTLILVGDGTGTREVTAATAVAPGNTVMTIGGGEFIILRSTESRSAPDVPAFVWTIISNYGVTLS